VLAQFVDAWHRRDITGITTLLRTDAELRMPPETVEFLGRDAIIGFFATVPAQGRLETIRLVPTQTNGHWPSPPLTPARTAIGGRMA
jgi:RNA polymerase sigma-70 factor (ECF subfamily)